MYAAGLQRGEPRGVVRNHEYLDAVHAGQALDVVVVVGLQLGDVVALPLLHLEGTVADPVVLCQVGELSSGVDGVGYVLGQNVEEGLRPAGEVVDSRLLEHDLYGLAVHLLHAVHQRVDALQPADGHVVGPVEYALVGANHVVGAQRLAVVPLDALADGVGPLGAVAAGLPLGGDLARDLIAVVGIDRRQVLEHVAEEHQRGHRGGDHRHRGGGRGRSGGHGRRGRRRFLLRGASDERKQQHGQRQQRENSRGSYHEGDPPLVRAKLPMKCRWPALAGRGQACP